MIWRRVSLWMMVGLVLGSWVVPTRSGAHCQIPCGIYDDGARVLAMLEDAETVRKSIRLIAELAAKPDVQSKQQLVRWVTNKEIHAERIIRTVSDYFLTQRVKPSQKDYSERLRLHHAVMLAAMKAKQNADERYGEELTKRIGKLKAYYPPHVH